MVHHLAIVESVMLEKNSLGLKTLDKIASEFSPTYDCFVINK